MKPIRIRVTPTDKASERTKDRIGRHGPIFQLIDAGYPLGKDAGELVELRSETGEGFHRWRGWIPTDHIEKHITEDISAPDDVQTYLRQHGVQKSTC